MLRVGQTSKSNTHTGHYRSPDPLLRKTLIISENKTTRRKCNHTDRSPSNIVLFRNMKIEEAIIPTKLKTYMLLFQSMENMITIKNIIFSQNVVF